MAAKIRKCKMCGKSFKPVSKKNIYCSNECRDTAKRKRAERYYKEKKKQKKTEMLEEKRCRHCYELFLPSSRRQIFCCDECRREEYKKSFPARKELKNIVVKDNKKSEKTLADINKIAKSKGLSYGQYMIFLQAKKDREERAKIS